MKRLLLVILCLSIMHSYAANFYVSFSQGNDNNTTAQAQNQATPWRTWDKVLAGINNGTITTGSTVFFKRGDSWLIPYDFNVTKGITFDAYGPGNIKPYVTSLFSVPNNGWTLKDANLGIWETTNSITAPRSNELNLLVINGKSYAKGRTPNATAANKGWLNYEGHTSTSITDNTIPFDNSYAGAEVVVRTSHSDIDRGLINSISGTTININTSTFPNTISDNGYGYFVQNSIKCLDKFGEWYYDKSTKKIGVCLGPLNTPSSFTVQYPSVDTMIQPKASNILFHNITFTGANRYIVYSDWSGLRNIWSRNCDFIYSGGDTYCLAQKIYVGVDSCTFAAANSCGVFIGLHSNSAYVTNCYIRDAGIFPGMFFPNVSKRYGDGIFFADMANITDTGLTAINNNIRNAGYCGMLVGDNNLLVAYNSVDSTSMVMDDGGCIYYYNFPRGSTIWQTNNVVFRNNILMHALGATEGCPGSGGLGAHGLYFDDRSNHVVATNNTMAFNQNSGFFMHNAHQNRFENNTLYDNGIAQVYMQDDANKDSIYKDTVRFNVMVATKSSEYIYNWALANGTVDSKNFDTWGVFNNNIIPQLPGVTSVSHLNHFEGVLFKDYTMTQWRSTWNYDINSSYKATNPSDMAFIYNTSQYTRSVSFPCDTYVSLRDTTYINSIVLNRASGNVLLLQH